MPHRLFATQRRAVATSVVSALLLLGSFSLASWSLYQGKQNICEGRGKTLNVLDAILIDSRKQSLNSVPRNQRAAVVEFYDRQLLRIDEARC